MPDTSTGRKTAKSAARKPARASTRTTAKKPAAKSRKSPAVAKSDGRGSKRAASPRTTRSSVTPSSTREVTGMSDEAVRAKTGKSWRSKTVDAPIDELFQAWSDTRQRKRWLGNVSLEVRKSTPPKSMRITWEEDGSNVDVMFYPKSSTKSQVSVQHDKLADRSQADRVQAYWGEKLERLKGLLES